MVQILKRIVIIALLVSPGLAQILTVPNGGTGKNTFTIHGPLIGNSTGAISASGPGVAGQCFISGGLSADPSFQSCPSGLPAGAANGDLVIYNGSTWAKFAGNTVGNRLLQEDTSGNASWVLPSSGGGALSALTAATATNTIASGNNAQTWNWVLTGSTSAMSIGETSASTGTGNTLFTINTLSGSTAKPFSALANGLGASVTSAGDLQMIGSTSSIFHNLNTAISGGASQWNAAARTFVATASNAASITLNDNLYSPGGIQFWGTGGLTPGSAFTPTLMATMDASGLRVVNLGGSGTTCVQADNNGITSKTGSPCYPGAGIANSTGTAWGTSYSASNQIPASFVAGSTTELCHNYTPGSAQTASNTSLINCTPSVPLVVGAHYRVLAGLRLVTGVGPGDAIVTINQGGATTGTGTIICNSNTGPALTASLTFDGMVTCEFTVTSSTNAVVQGGYEGLISTTATANKGLMWNNTATITTTGTPTIDMMLGTTATTNTLTGQNITVIREY